MADSVQCVHGTVRGGEFSCDEGVRAADIYRRLQAGRWNALSLLKRSAAVRLRKRQSVNVSKMAVLRWSRYIDIFFYAVAFYHVHVEVSVYVVLQRSYVEKWMQFNSLKCGRFFYKLKSPGFNLTSVLVTSIFPLKLIARVSRDWHLCQDRKSGPETADTETRRYKWLPWEMKHKIWIVVRSSYYLVLILDSAFIVGNGSRLVQL